MIAASRHGWVGGTTPMNEVNDRIVCAAGCGGGNKGEEVQRGGKGQGGDVGEGEEEPGIKLSNHRAM